MENDKVKNLNASYEFYSATTKTKYKLNVTTGPLTYPIHALDNPNCKGYTIISGTLIVSTIGTSPATYNVPSTTTGFIYNGLWTSAADSPSGAENPWCNGIDRLVVAFPAGGTIFAKDSGSIIVANGTITDTATLVSSVFPPTA